MPTSPVREPLSKTTIIPSSPISRTHVNITTLHSRLPKPFPLPPLLFIQPLHLEPFLPSIPLLIPRLQRSHTILTLDRTEPPKPILATYSARSAGRQPSAGNIPIA